MSSFAYTNDALGRRTRRVDRAQGLPVTNVFAYNLRSEVTNAAMGASTYSYSYDGIGNREQATAGAAQTVYAANALNQYASVTVAGQGVPVAYDADGNMLTNGVWVYAWDAENRMVSASNTVSGVAVANAYDYMNRRVLKISGSVTRRYVWDGWNIAAEIVIDAAAGSTNVHFYTWGLDVSGTVQGAGGVGGLLADTRVSSDTSYLSPLTYYPTYDANGNVTDYVDASGNLRARYMFSAFGETTSQSGDMAAAFTHRFSTKPFDVETGVSKYQLRDYLPGLGRWASRDPIEEDGGANLNGFLDNGQINQWDYLGLARVLTAEEAKQLACAINKWIPKARPISYVLWEVHKLNDDWGIEKDYGPSGRFLKNFMSKSGSDIWVEWADLKYMPSIRSANMNARNFFDNGGRGAHVEEAATMKGFHA